MEDVKYWNFLVYINEKISYFFFFYYFQNTLQPIHIYNCTNYNNIYRPFKKLKYIIKSSYFITISNNIIFNIKVLCFWLYNLIYLIYFNTFKVLHL